MYDSIDLFAGAGGWSVAARNLGLTDLGIEVWKPAVDTRNAAGLCTVQADIRLVNPLDDVYLAPGLIASPPCQQFSAAGKGEGRVYLDTVCALVEHLEWQRASGLPEGAQLIMEPLRWIISRVAVEQPFRWIAMEQVPTCLPVWESYAVALRKLGYSVAVGKLQAETYGTPQTRQRAILVARLEGEAALPEPTHSRYYSREPQRMDEGVLPWVSMAESLGWDDDFEAVSNYGTGGDSANRGRRTGDQPSATVTSKVDRVKFLRSNYSAGSSQSGTTAERGRAVRAIEDPAFTVSGRGGDSWVHVRPSTTVNADARISKPGRHDPNVPGSQQKGAIRVTPAEAGVLQGFPADFPWHGTKTQQYTLAGNAVPVQLAEAVLRAVAL